MSFEHASPISPIHMQRERLAIACLDEARAAFLGGLGGLAIQLDE